MTLEQFKNARNVLQGVLRPTHLISSPYLSRLSGNNVYLKPENMQVTGAYKIRGAYYKISTLSPEENEETVRWFLQSFPAFSPRPFSLAGMAAPEGMLRLYPHRVRGEGHFIACLTKSGEAPAADLLRPAAERLSPPSPPLRAAYAAFAAHLTGLPDANAQFGDVLIAAPDLPPLDHLRVLRAGVQLGLLKGRVFVPDHALAMVLSPACGLPCVALCRADALRYQRGEALPVSESLAGWALVVYEGLVLGLGKASGGQLKNHYPKGLRRP